MLGHCQAVIVFCKFIIVKSVLTPVGNTRSLKRQFTKNILTLQGNTIIFTTKHKQKMLKRSYRNWSNCLPPLALHISRLLSTRSQIAVQTQVLRYLGKATKTCGVSFSLLLITTFTKCNYVFFHIYLD